MAPGVYGACPVLSAWLANNSETHYQCATGVALGVTWLLKQATISLNTTGEYGILPLSQCA